MHKLYNIVNVGELNVPLFPSIVDIFFATMLIYLIIKKQS